MESYKVTPEGKTVLVIDLSVSPVVKKARKMPVAALTAHVPQGRIFAPAEPVPAAHLSEPEPDDDWQYSIPEEENGALEEYARPAAPVPKGFLAADLSGSESEDDEEDIEDDDEDIVVDLATKYPKRTVSTPTTEDLPSA